MPATGAKMTPMNELVIDTCVAVKWHVQSEPGARDALSILRAHLDGQFRIIAPEIIVVELANALRYSTDASGPWVDEAIADTFALDLALVPAGEMLVRSAAQIALEHGITIYDALFAALARKRGCPLVTCDRKAFGRLPSNLIEVRFI